MLPLKFHMELAAQSASRISTCVFLKKLSFQLVFFSLVAWAIWADLVFLSRQTWMSPRRARLPSWGLWWRPCVKQQWKVSTLTKRRFVNVCMYAAAKSKQSSLPCTNPASCTSPTDENPNCRVDTAIIQKRLPVLLKYLNSDTERQLQALYALQALIVSLDQPPSKCSNKANIAMVLILKT